MRATFAPALISVLLLAQTAVGIGGSRAYGRAVGATDAGRSLINSGDSDVALGIAARSNAFASIAAHGEFVAAVWAATLDGVADVYAATSSDGGRTFRTPVRVNRDGQRASVGAERPPRVVVSSGDGTRVITVAWTASRADGSGTDLLLARSADEGRRFQPAVTVQAEGAPGLRGWASLAAAPDGTIQAVWLDGREAAGAAASATRPEGAAARSHHHGSGHAAARQDLFHARIAAGASAHEQPVATAVCFCCKTAVGTDTGGGVVMAWRHVFPSSERDIAIARSMDGGRSFGAMSRISHDRWRLDACPDDGPALAVGTDGGVHLVWPTEAEGRRAIFYTRSTGGGSFAPRVRLDAAGTAGSSPGHPQIAIMRSGELAAAWDETTGDGREVVAVRLDRNGTPAAGAPLRLPGGHPALTSVEDSFVVAWSRPSADGMSRISVRRLP
jgi:uncharacterized protein (DUF736 family)